jgi:ABC-2 type transport system ATP-binding protein
MTQDDLAIDARGVRVAYGPLLALDDLTLAVPRGEVLGLLGPNGAGKSTFVACLAGLRRIDGGQLRVLGLDPARDGAALRLRVGVQLQQAALPDRLRVGEAAELFAALYPRTADPAALLERWGLAGLRRRPFGALSGGERQRLLLVLALLHEPELLVLDELTTGLDPEARRAAWGLVAELRDAGLTVLLVTHDVREAEALCDRVAVLAGGRILACAPPGDFGAGDLEHAYLALTAPDREEEPWPASAR